ncbi:MAG: aminoglycoside phosphotransferase, partial [Nitrospirae bacterium]
MSLDWSKILSSSDAFPESPSSIKAIQTHISYVFVLDDVVYKIKKPVDFGFLDFTTLEKRKHFCEKELELNRRLCPDLYLGVEPIVKTPQGYQIGGEGEVVDYAVKMKRMPEEGMMSNLLRKNSITERHIDLIVDALVEFYKNARTGPGVDEYGSIETVRFNTEENFSQTASYVGTAIGPHRYEYIVSYTRDFIEANRDLFERRIKEGRIREGHGDLYSQNICFKDTEKVYIFDCIEFNERFRSGDVASEVAFLSMDLDYHGRQDLSDYFVKRFIEKSGDRELLQILDFYKTYRAYVRGKIGCFTYSSEEVPENVRAQALEDAKRYFNLAYGYSGGRPTVFVVFGLTGTGKTTLSKALSSRSLATHISSDITRKALAGVRPEEKHLEPYERGIYSSDFTERTYQRMLTLAEEAILEGRDVILDGTYR